MKSGSEEEESIEQAQEGLIRKGLIRTEEDTIHIDVTFEDSKEIVKNFIVIKQNKMEGAFENLAFIALILLNKFTNLSEDEVQYLISIALAETEPWKEFLKRLKE